MDVQIQFDVLPLLSKLANRASSFESLDVDKYEDDHSSTTLSRRRFTGFVEKIQSFSHLVAEGLTIDDINFVTGTKKFTCYRTKH